MKNFLKKYWSHIISLGFLIYCDILFILISNGIFETLNVGIIFLLIGIEFLFVIGVWIEIIYYIVHAVKHKEIKNNAICAVLIYFFNVIYIPCYSLKYASKDEKYKNKNMTYLITSIILYILLFVLIIKFEIQGL